MKITQHKISFKVNLFKQIDSFKLRGAIGSYLKNNILKCSNKCSTCHASSDCIFHHCFIKQLVKPFSLRLTEEDEGFIIYLTMFGIYSDDTRLLEALLFYLKRINASNIIIKTEKIKPTQIKNCQYNNTKNIKIVIESPLSIYSEKQLISFITPDKLYAAIYRRAKMLSDLFGADINFDNEIDSIKSATILSYNVALKQMERYSFRQKRNILLEGVVGDFIIDVSSLNKENKAKVTKIIKLGELIQVGKSTAMGMGCYKIEFS